MTRFRRTKEEIASGLTPTEAKAKRFPLGEPNKTIAKRDKIRAFKLDDGEIIIRIRPDKNVDLDYFSHLDGQEILLELDNDSYKWVDHYLSKVYDNAGSTKLFRDILDKGLSEMISHVHFEKDIQ